MIKKKKKKSGADTYSNTNTTKNSQSSSVIFDEEIDVEIENKRCQRYGFHQYQNITTTTNNNSTVTVAQRRRIFWGTLIADDSWNAIATQAIESYGIFHTAAFVESNRTQMYHKRSLRFYNNQDTTTPNNNATFDTDNSQANDGGASVSASNLKLLVNGSLFGPTTTVTVDYYVNEDEEMQYTPHLHPNSKLRLVSLDRENAQREMILQRWKKNGMTTQDIGYISDIDELFSRDFLRAVQICSKIKKFDPTNCDTSYPKITSSKRIRTFESSPLCSKTNNQHNQQQQQQQQQHKKKDYEPQLQPQGWHHPDMIIGTCIQGIGVSGNSSNSSSRSIIGGRLWNGGDFRDRSYNEMKTIPTTLLDANNHHNDNENKNTSTTVLYLGYHYHNPFMSVEAMKRKYLTYGHSIVFDPTNTSLRTIHKDLQFMVDCVVRYDVQDHERNQQQYDQLVSYQQFLDTDSSTPLRGNTGTINDDAGTLTAIYDFVRKEQPVVSVPLAFLIPSYIEIRHRELYEMLK